MRARKEEAARPFEEPGSLAFDYARTRRVAERRLRSPAGRAYLNFAELSTTGQRLFGAETYARLRRVKATYDPQDVIRSNHPVPPARPARERTRRSATRRVRA